jgi:large repetitive protein
MIHHLGRRPSDRARLRSQRYGTFNVERLECRRLLYGQPVANNDSADTPDDTPAAINVLANDSDPNSGAMLVPSTVTVVTGPSDGSAIPNPTSGQVTYTPDPGFTGTDQLTYTVADNLMLTSNLATVTIQVFKPAAPFANNENEATSPNKPIAIDILANDTDPNPGGMPVPSTVMVGTGPSHGSTSLDTITGDITYTPATGFSGTDQFTYTVSDNFGLTSNVATVIIQVTANAPVAKLDTAVTPVNTPVVINVLANDTDPNAGGALIPTTIVIIADPGHGLTPMVNPGTGAITYTPDPGFLGTDQFTYTVNDNFGLTSNPATVTIQVIAIAPIANNDNTVTPANMPVVIPVLANDTDPNPGGTLNSASVTIVKNPSHGPKPLVNPINGAITYIPDPGYSGMDQFTYTVSDNFGLTSNPATVTIQVTSSITVTGMRFPMYPGLQLNNVPIATFTDTNLSTLSGPYFAAIDWGNGQTSTGAVGVPNASGVFSVTTSYIYPAAFTFQFVPGTALPVSITITDSSSDVGTANSSAVLLSSGSSFTGGLTATPQNGPNASAGFATTDEPTFSGTAPPLSVVQLRDPMAILGQVVTSATGQWSFSAMATLPEGTYDITATVTIPGVFQSGTIDLPITIDTVAPRLAPGFPTWISTGNDVAVEFDDSSGMYTSSLLTRRNYTLFGHGLAAFHPKGVILETSGGAGNTMIELILKVKPRELRKINSLKISGIDYVVGSSGSTVNSGVADNAGNRFQDNSRIPIVPASGSSATSVIVKRISQSDRHHRAH